MHQRWCKIRLERKFARYHMALRRVGRATLIPTSFFNKMVGFVPLPTLHFKWWTKIIMNEITYLKGDATSPQAKGNKIICHVCNDIGRWGKGFVMAISKRWAEPEAAYKKWYGERANNDFELGAVQIVQVDSYVWVANMVGQRGIKTGSKGPPIRYEAVEKCLSKVSQKATELNASVHMPRIGCGLAGGKWSEIEPIIKKTLGEVSSGFVYDFE